MWRATNCTGKILYALFATKRNNKNCKSSTKSTSHLCTAKILKDILCDVRSVNRSSDLLMETTSANQSLLLSNCKEMCSFCLSVHVHSTMDYIRDVNFEHDILHFCKSRTTVRD